MRDQIKNVGGVRFHYPWTMDDTELDGYVKHIQTMHPEWMSRLESVIIQINGIDEILIKYNFRPVDFERVRRITGYLAEEKRWNGAKLAELEDRVCHA
jgi:hypothetical protein